MAAIECQKQYCGEVFVTTNYVAMLECKFCFDQFVVYGEFLNHIFDKHFDNIDECKNYIDEDDMDILNAFESADDAVGEFIPPADGSAHTFDSDLYPANNCSPHSTSQVQQRHVTELYYSVDNTQAEESNEQSAEVSTSDIIENVKANQKKSDNKRQSTSSKMKVPNPETQAQPNIRPVMSTCNKKENAYAMQLKSGGKQCFSNEQQQDSNAETKAQPNLRPVMRKHIAKRDVERKFKCKFCGLDFFCKKNLNKHEQRHSNNKPFACTICSKTFFSRTELTTHTRWHTGERPFICPYCGRGFVTPGALNTHEKRHLNKRTFKCDQCDKSYYCGVMLRQHLISHTGERNFICKQCNKAFTRRTALKTHMKLHENALRYECNICHMRFNQKPTLLWHKRRKHELVLGADAEKANNVVAIKQMNETLFNDIPSANGEEFQYIGNNVGNTKSYVDPETEVTANFF